MIVTHHNHHSPIHSEEARNKWLESPCFSCDEIYVDDYPMNVVKAIVVQLLLVVIRYILSINLDYFYSRSIIASLLLLAVDR